MDVRVSVDVSVRLHKIFKISHVELCLSEEIKHIQTAQYEKLSNAQESFANDEYRNKKLP